MPCPVCGDICRCSSEPFSPAPPRWLPNDESGISPAKMHPDLEAEEGAEGISQSSTELDPPSCGPDALSDSSAESSSAWRQELASRLNRYQARRKPRPPRYPSLRLRFEEPCAISPDAEPHASAPAHTASGHALALDRFAGSAARAVEFVSSSELKEQEALSPSLSGEEVRHAATSAKIIEFPRFWTPPSAPLDQLAEPVIDRPRILEAPETVPPPPALGGIMIEPAQQPEIEKRPGIDIPLHSAPLARRILSAAIDGVIVAAACTVFGFIFYKMSATMSAAYPGVAIGLAGLFWAAYQHLLLVYCGTTPGLRLAGLHLAKFDGRPAGRSLRRWRVLASFLSAISLGMGYAWVFLDEDALCWHDRITHTYLAPRTNPSEIRSQKSGR